jgi:hypothetical protein
MEMAASQAFVGADRLLQSSNEGELRGNVVLRVRGTHEDRRKQTRRPRKPSHERMQCIIPAWSGTTLQRAAFAE